MMRFLLLMILFTLGNVMNMAYSQVRPQILDPHCRDASFHKEVQRYTSTAVPLIDVDDLRLSASEYMILDTRSLEEYNVSHIPGAIYVGYEDFEVENVAPLLRDGKKVALYCSIGYRSEKIGAQLLSAGVKNVVNVYGSIFEWANRGYDLEDQAGRTTHTLHTYDKKWSRWVTRPNLIKVW